MPKLLKNCCLELCGFGFKIGRARSRKVRATGVVCLCVWLCVCLCVCFVSFFACSCLRFPAALALDAVCLLFVVVGSETGNICLGLGPNGENLSAADRSASDRAYLSVMSLCLCVFVFVLVCVCLLVSLLCL